MKESWAIILAAGESSRMGEPKMLLPFGRMTVIENVIETAITSFHDRIMIVTGAYRDEIIMVTKHLPVKYCHNENYKRGMLSSVQKGFASLPENCVAAMVFLGDQPMIRPDVTSKLTCAYEINTSGIIVPLSDGKRGHPVIIDCRYRDEIMKLNPDLGLKGLLESHKSEVIEVEVETSTVLRDIDTKEDYIRELKLTI